MNKHDQDFKELQDRIEGTLSCADRIAGELRRRLHAQLTMDECAMRCIPWYKLAKWYRMHRRVEEVERILSISSSMELIASIPDLLYADIGYASD